MITFVSFLMVEYRPSVEDRSGPPLVTSLNFKKKTDLFHLSFIDAIGSLFKIVFTIEKEWISGVIDQEKQKCGKNRPNNVD
jgi:hypothetical protein